MCVCMYIHISYAYNYKKIQYFQFMKTKIPNVKDKFKEAKITTM